MIDGAAHSPCARPGRRRVSILGCLPSPETPEPPSATAPAPWPQQAARRRDKPAPGQPTSAAARALLKLQKAWRRLLTCLCGCRAGSGGCEAPAAQRSRVRLRYGIHTIPLASRLPRRESRAFCVTKRRSSATVFSACLAPSISQHPAGSRSTQRRQAKRERASEMSRGRCVGVQPRGAPRTSRERHAATLLSRPSGVQPRCPRCPRRERCAGSERPASCALASRTRSVPLPASCCARRKERGGPRAALRAAAVRWDPRRNDRCGNQAREQRAADRDAGGMNLKRRRCCTYCGGGFHGVPSAPRLPAQRGGRMEAHTGVLQAHAGTLHAAVTRLHLSRCGTRSEGGFAAKISRGLDAASRRARRAP
jgi:hypothetical protein